MNARAKKSALVILLVLAVAAVVLNLSLKLLPSRVQITEMSVEVAEIERLDSSTWSVSRNAAAQKLGQPGTFLVRLRHLRAEKIPVKVVGEAEGQLFLRSDKLESGDLVILEPGEIQTGQALAPIAGVDEKRLISLTLKAGMASAVAEDLDESVRFLSPRYRDNLGFDNYLMRELLEEAYEQFDEPQIEIIEPPAIRVEENQAMVHAQVRVTAKYQGYRNYLLGDQEGPNSVLILMDKTACGWKVSRIDGLQPLGFDEKFFKYLGAQVGVSLTEKEQVEKQQFCMPCRRRMDQLFGRRR